ncbi:vacuolar membrane protein [Cryptococcus wingfieldii CBS 7118]|uniref:Vacuolar membrane protein n=1 Tax=Cryptococcus wingfieldii CBS 7118 TaxID=1295528 RepID=A0A1E3J4U8_9TREE|nr:vacuolar membrane protein [Cryptococcus wingfieldii CBS 7118]ODN95874.1 vacuolar membrane protein [Cryptococcus wingfieldii CBS 7118]
MSPRAAYLTIFWACLKNLQVLFIADRNLADGFHLPELNFPEQSITCTSASTTLLPECLSITPSLYSLITALFTLGGLLGSSTSSNVVSQRGLKGGIALTGWLNLIGAGIMTFAPHWTILALGRLVAGTASGLGISLVPPFLSVIAKSEAELASKSGMVGTMNQLAIVLGICSGQVAGLLLTGEKGEVPGSWRYVTAISGAVAVAQILSAGIISSPTGEHKAPASPVDAESGPRDEAASPLLPGASSTPQTQLTLPQILSNPSLRGPSILCAAIMALQQLSGVNAVMFYSTPVLRPLLPTSVGVVGVGITVVNAIMTLPAIFLMDRLGRKTLILASIGGMATTSVLLAFGLNDHLQALSAISIIAFIASFSIGLGPVPFLLTSELVPQPAVAALSSLAISTNWVTAFLVALFFLPLRDLLSSPVDPRQPENGRKGEGRVFYVFTIVLLLGGVMILRGLKTRQ